MTAGHRTDQQLLRPWNHKYLILTVALLTCFAYVDAEDYVGCLLSEDVCDENETCFDDYAFGRCISNENAGPDDFYRYPVFSLEQESKLETEMTRLYQSGFIWTDEYTQCVLQTALAAIRDPTTQYEDEYCDMLLETSDAVDDITEEANEDDIGEPILYPDEEAVQEVEQTEPQLSFIDLRDVEEPIELQGIEDLPLDRNKLYQYWIDDPDQEQQDKEGQEEIIDYDTDYDMDQVLDRRVGRVDVKKPGPFFEASPNNFFLDKLTYRYDTDEPENHTEDKNTDKNTTAVVVEDPGQQEYEYPMSTSANKAKRVLNTPDQELSNEDYVHIALSNPFQRWREGSDFINALAWELGLPEHALSDRTIEKQHVQFKVEPNEQNVDALRIAEALSDDISIQKRLTDTLGVDIAKVAAGKRDDRSSVFPHGQNLNLLILVVVGASATASLIVGGLIFALASRRRRCKKVSKLQLADEAEEKGKVQEEYKQLCRDWSKTSNTSEATKKPVPGPLAKIHSADSNGSNGSARSSTSSWTDEPANNSMDISTGHMVLAYMEDHLKNKQRLEQEWVGLCGYEAEPSSTAVAFKAENKKKNRYPDKLPYDHNRVILNALVSASNSDYVNASAVTDHDPRNPSYIVTQGPLGQSVADFWQMVWEQGCVVIVMLTRLQDNGYQLCTRYWPEEGSEQYHIFEVHLVSEHVWCEDYLVRSVYLKNTRTGETRTVTQFHFRSWPAHGVPSSTKALLEFRRKVNKSYRGRSCPIVVHCSDGVGRSGTYVLIDMVLNRLSKGCKEIDIAATLEHIRDQRGGMVQNRQQFEFCLMAVAEEVHAILKALPQ